MQSHCSTRFAPYLGNPLTKNQIIILIVVAVILGFGTFLTFKVHIGPSAAMIQTSSIACEEELTEALVQLEVQLGTSAEVTNEEIQELLATSNLERTFRAGAARTTYSFRILLKNNQCLLRAWKQVYGRPGDTSQNAKDYGSIYLVDCLCAH